jgi:hypothetical protein
MICLSCGCSESRPCVDEATGTACRWTLPELCSACDPDSVEFEEPFDRAVDVPLPAELGGIGLEASSPAVPSYRRRVVPRRAA